MVKAGAATPTTNPLLDSFSPLLLSLSHHVFFYPELVSGSQDLYDIKTRLTLPRDSGRPYGDYGGGVHLFPFRTEKLSPPALMVLR